MQILLNQVDVPELNNEAIQQFTCKPGKAKSYVANSTMAQTGRLMQKSVSAFGVEVRASLSS